MSANALSTLNNFMKAYPSGHIQLDTDQRLNIALYDLLAKNVDKTTFKAGTTYDFLIETAQAYSAQANREQADLPDAGVTGFVKATIAIKEIIAIAAITKQARDFATGNNDAAWGNIVQHAIDMMMRDFKNTLSIAAIGDGTGKLARAVSNTAATGASGFFAGATYTHTNTVVCDNTYTDYGWENVKLLKPGMLVDVIDATDGITKVLERAIVGAVTFGDRANSTATTGTVVLWSTAAADPVIADNDIIALHNSHYTENGTAEGTAAVEGTYYLPMGLTGLISDNTEFGALTTTFQGLTRTSYPSLLSTIYEATDFGPSGAADGTPTTWDLSVISDAINANYDRSGKAIDAILVNSSLAIAMSRLNRGNDIIVNTSSQSGAYSQAAAGGQVAKSFIDPWGKAIPILCDPNISPNMLFGLCTEDLTLFTKGSFDFTRESGDVWEPQRGTRKEIFEAPYAGYVNIGAERCDTSFAMLDLKSNVS